MEIEKLPAEIESGNIEYKLKVIPDNVYRLDQLASQMKWRLLEGNGIAYYYLGINDDGKINGINIKDYNLSIQNLSKITKIIDAKIKNTEEKKFKDLKWYVIKVEFNKIIMENTRILFLGPSSSGKTTLISNLVNNITDDGNGKSRNLVFNHKHEIYSGRTSSISIEKKVIKRDNEFICVNMIDTPGYSKFLKTTITGLCKYDCEMIILCIDPINIKFDELFFYLRLLKFYKSNFIITFTKKDIYQNYHKTYVLRNILEFVNKEFSKANLRYIPILEISNVTKSGYRKLLNKIDKINIKKNIKEEKLQFKICDILKIPNIGKIYTGILLKGVLEKNKDYIMSNSETSDEVRISSIHYNDKSFDSISSNQLVTIQLSNDLDFSNKTDKIISERHLVKSKKLKVKCDREITSNSGICIYSNQYCLVSIKKIDNYYELFRSDGFINLYDKIILKVNDEYFFTTLIK